jgi:hypothetical protein
LLQGADAQFETRKSVTAFVLIEVGSRNSRLRSARERATLNSC